MKARDADILTISGDAIAAHLERTGYVNFAAHVRYIDGRLTDANRQRSQMVADYNRLLERLDKYEPRNRDRPHDPTPPANASD